MKALGLVNKSMVRRLVHAHGVQVSPEAVEVIDYYVMGAIQKAIATGKFKRLRPKHLAEAFRQYEFDFNAFREGSQ